MVQSFSYHLKVTDKGLDIWAGSYGNVILFGDFRIKPD